MPKISVIIPSYNCERYISETIDSILGQSLKDIELIVVDDGSTDRTQEIVSSYGPPVRLLTQTNSGVCAARNHGIREAIGDFICLMDHDDYWFPHKLARQLEEFQTHPEAGVVFSDFIWWHADKNGNFPAPDSYDLATYADDTVPRFSGWIYHEFLLDCCILTSTAMFRAEVFRKCGDLDESLPYSEDWDLFLRAAREYPMIMLRRPTTLYRQHAKQGNRVIRDIDYRTLLLTKTAEKWGLCSPDGRCVTRHQLEEKLGAYHAGFGLRHLQGGRRIIAMRSLIIAWRYSPTKIKYLAYLVAGLFGWAPKW